MINKSAGILIVYDNKILLTHSTNSRWWKSYMPPKGKIEKGETLSQTASREVKEETSIYIDPELLNDYSIVEYRTSEGKIYKIVYLFVYKINSLSDINLNNEHVPYEWLQENEIDEAKFMSIEEVEKKIHPRYMSHVLQFLNK